MVSMNDSKQTKWHESYRDQMLEASYAYGICGFIVKQLIVKPDALPRSKCR